MTYGVRMQTMVGQLEFERHSESEARALASKLQNSARVPVELIDSVTGQMIKFGRWKRPGLSEQNGTD